MISAGTPGRLAAEADAAARLSWRRCNAQPPVDGLDLILALIRDPAHAESQIRAAVEKQE